MRDIKRTTKAKARHPISQFFWNWNNKNISVGLAKNCAAFDLHNVQQTQNNIFENFLNFLKEKFLVRVFESYRLLGTMTIHPKQIPLKVYFWKWLFSKGVTVFSNFLKVILLIFNANLTVYLCLFILLTVLPLVNFFRPIKNQICYSCIIHRGLDSTFHTLLSNLF